MRIIHYYSKLFTGVLIRYRASAAGLDADTKFLLELRETCAAQDTEYAARTKARQDEITAVGEALKEPPRRYFPLSLCDAFLRLSVVNDLSFDFHLFNRVDA